MTTEQLVRRASRPHMPADYGLPAAKSEADLLPWSWLEERMAQAHNYWISTTRPDGRPHAMPVWGLWLEGAFYFSSGRRARKAQNLAANPGLAVHLESGDEVVILEGVAEEATDPALLARYAAAYDAKYQINPETDNPIQVIYTLRPVVAFAWLERDFPNTATRWGFER